MKHFMIITYLLVKVISMLKEKNKKSIFLIKKNLLFFSIFLFFSFVVAGFFLGIRTDYTIDHFSKASVESSFYGSLIYFAHNGIIILTPLCGLFTFGISSLFFAVYEGITIGYLLGFTIANNLSVLEVICRLFHGILEIPAMIIAIQTGFLGVYIFNSSKRKYILQIRNNIILIYVLLLLSGLLEAIVTPIFYK